MSADPALAGPDKPNFDRREQLRPPKAKLAPERQKGADRLTARLPDVQIDIDPLQGSPKFIRSRGRFLTGLDGEGQGVAPDTAAKVPKNEAHRAVKTFLKEYEDLFGHKAELLDKAKVKRDYGSGHNGMRTVVWEQELDELPVFEANLRANLSAKGELVNIGTHFLADLEAAAGQPAAKRDALISKPPIPAGKAVALAAQSIGEIVQEADLNAQEQPQGKIRHQSFKAPGLNHSTTHLLWFPLASDNLRLCWQVILTSRAQGQLFRVLVDAQTGEVLLQDNLTSDLSTATYNVYTSDSPSPFSPGHPTPLTNQPPFVSRTLVTIDAVSTNASPLGWISDGGNTTVGNNVDAHLDVNNDDVPDPGSRPVGSPSRVFNFPINFSQQPSNYAPASVVQLFYWNNWMHDKLYDLGFTEAAGNFQATNFNRGGIEGDPVQADCQDASAQAPSNKNRNNANFSTPPEPPDPRYPAWQPRMQMYIFPGPSPARDGSLDAEIVLHEYTHGLSSRLVGGGVGIRSLQTQGMGEGWSDFYALSLLSESGDDVDGQYPAAGYVSYQLNNFQQNYYTGIRRYPYTTDITKNPLTFKDIDPAQASRHTGTFANPVFTNTPANEVHAMGEVWCATLWEARAAMIKKYGYATGNKKMLQLVTDGMKLSPVNPTFLAARDAILQADLLNEGGANHPILWAAFAKRGMGASATSPASTTTAGVVEAFDTPLSGVTVSVTVPSHLSSLNSLVKIGGTAGDPTGAGILNNQVVFTLYQNGDFWTGSRWKANTSAQDSEVQLKAPLVNWQWSYTQVPSGSSQRSGAYYVSAAVYDMNGSPSAPRPGINSIQFTVDNSAPSVTITNPPNGAVISNLTVISGTASDAADLEVVRLYLYRYSDGKFWDSYSWGGGGSAILPTDYDPVTGIWHSTGGLPIMGGSDLDTSMPNGSYDIMAFAVDSAGNETRIDSVVTVDYHPVYTWTAGSWNDSDPSNNNNLWGNPANWNPYGVPPEEAQVVIHSGDPACDYLGFVRVHRLSMDGGNLWAGSMEVKYLDIAGGRFAPTGSVQIADGGVFNWSGGQLEPGTYNNPTSGTVNINGAGNKFVYNAVFNNSGTVLWTGGNVFGHHVTFNNGPTGLWDAQAEATLNLFPNFGDGNRYFVNWGTFLKSAGTNSSLQGYFTNFGIVEVRTGALHFYDSLTMQPGSSIAGAGKVRVINGCCGAKLDLPGTATVSGTLELAESNARLRGAGTLFLTSEGTLQISDGWVSDNVTIGGTGTVLWNGGGGFEGNNLLGPGVTTIVAGSASKSLGAGAVLRNQGTIRWQGPGSIYNYGYYLTQRAAITNLSGGVFDIKSDGTPFSYAYNRSWFHNQSGARLIKSGGSGDSLLSSFEIHNEGEINCASGNLRSDDVLFLEHGSVLTGAGRFSIANGSATLNGTALLSGPTLLLSGGTLTGSSSNAVFTTSGSGVFEWSGGRIEGVLTVGTNGQARIGGSSAKTLGDAAVFNNAGNLTWSGSGEIYNYSYYLTQRATINNYGLFTITGDAGVTSGYNISTMNNQPGGVLRKTAGVGDTTINWVFNNDGTVEVTGGRLALNGGGSSSGVFSAGGTGTVRFIGGVQTLQNGVRLSGLGTHQVAGGTVNLNGTVTLGESGTANLLEVSTGTLAGKGKLAGVSTFHWTGGTIGGDLELGPALVMNIDGVDAKTLGSAAHLSNRSIVNWSGPGMIYTYAYYLTDRSTFDNQSNAVFNLLTDGQVFSAGYNSSSFNNLAGARFVKAQGAGTNFVNNFIFNNNGEVRANTGTMEFSGSLNLGPGTALNGNGTIRFNGDIVANATLPSTTHIQLLGGSFLGQTDTNGTPLVTYTGPGLFDWNGGTINGALNLASNSTMNLSGLDAKTLGAAAVLNNYGVINWAGPGRIYNYAYYMDQRANLNNRAGGRVNVTTDGPVFDNAYYSPLFNNEAGARFSKVGGTGTTPLNNFVVNNRGEILAQTGTFQFEGFLNVYPQSVFAATGGRFSSSASVNHFGKLTLNGAAFQMTAGAWTSDSAQPGTIETSNGGVFDWAGGTIYGTFTLSANGQMLISGSATKALNEGAVLENYGTVTWSGSGNIDNYAYYLTQRATINNHSGAAWIVTGTGSLTASYNAPFFNNLAGAVFKKAGSGTVGSAWTFAQDGTLELEGGTLAINGTCNFGASGTLRLSLGGVTAPADFGTLALSQLANLNGLMSVVTRNGFAPSESNSFTVVTYPSKLGQFVTQTMPALPLIQKWNVNYGANALTLNVIRAHRIDSPAKMQNGNFQMTFNGPAASAAIFQASLDLIHWESLQTNSPFNGTFQFQDGKAPVYSNRFYRILIVP